MDLLKEAALKTIERLPNGCSLEDIMYEINLVANVLEGVKDAEAGKMITAEELLKRVEKWGR